MLQRTRTASPTRINWSQNFFDPIPLPNRKPLITLRDAAHYIASLPKAEQEHGRWQTATEALLLNAEHGGDLLFSRIAMLKALHRREPKAEAAPNRKRTKTFTIIR
jgi:hypothetical protein